MRNTFDDLHYLYATKKMKFFDLVSPKDFKVPKDKYGICIYVQDKEEYDVLMQHLETLGWKFAYGYGASVFYCPTSIKYIPEFKYIYLGQFNLKPDIVITLGSTYWDRHHDLFEIDNWDIEQAPRNNDGRDICYWCGAPCKQIQGITNTYTVCTGCGK